jgi:hypothetical protein
METIAMSRKPHGTAIAGLILAALLITIAGCAGRMPSIEQPRIRNKLDLRLQSALGGRNVGEVLGEYIQVSVRLKSAGTQEDLDQLTALGVPGQFRGPIITMNIAPSKIVDLADLDRVTFIELAARNVPNPSIPPSPSGS